jgi:arsenite methyltransferase
MSTVDIELLESKVKDMYRRVALDPHAAYHFEMGRPVAERLGYSPAELRAVPPPALDSFAGVGYFFDLADLRAGEQVVDLGSGSGTDAFVAASLVGPEGRVIGVDFTSEQLTKARLLAHQTGIGNVDLREGDIEKLPVDDQCADCVISNGVVNLVPDKAAVFAEAARVLRPGGRLALADIVTEQQLTESIVCNADLWASCIGGAAQEDSYRQAIEEAGLRVERVRENPYEFLSAQARTASVRYGVKSISLLAVKVR